MGDVVVLPVVHRVQRFNDGIADGGKARILARRELIGLAKQGGPIVQPDSLVMLQPDTVEYPCDVQPVA